MAAEVIEFLLSGFTDNSGNPLNGGKIYSYAAGTVTPKDTYTDSAKVTPSANPIILDSNGRKQAYAEGSYKFVIKTSADVLLYTFDNLSFGLSGAVIGGGTSSGSANVYAITPSPAVGGYNDGDLFSFKAHQTNLSTATLNSNGVGPKTLSTIPGQIVIGRTYLARYTSATDRFNLVNPDPAENISQADISALNTAGVGEIVIREPITMTGNLTLTQPLRILKGGVITTAGYTLTINGAFNADKYSCFTLSAAGQVVFGDKAVKEVLPEWFGALADDSTDNHTAFAYALASLPVRGTLKFGPGIYRGYLNIDKNNISIEGCGAEITTIKAVDTTNHIFTAASSDVKIRGIKFLGIAVATDGSTTLFGIFSASANPAVRLLVENCSFSSNNNGIKFDASCNYGRVVNCHFSNFVGNVSGVGYGILSGNQTGLQVIGCFFFGSGSNGRHAVYLSAGANYSQVKNNYIQDFYWQGINQNQPSASPVPIGNQINGNILVNCVTGGNATSGAIGAYGNSKDLQICQNQIYGSGSKGIALDITDATSPLLLNTIISGNLIDNSQTIGIDNIGGVGTLIEGNIVYNSGQVSSGAHAGIRLASDGFTASSKIIIANNICTASANQKCALQFNATVPTPTNVKLIGNYFETGTVTDIEDNSIIYTIEGKIRHRETYDVTSLNTLTQVKQTFTVTGAVPGDPVSVCLSGDAGGLSVTGYVKSNDTVEVVFFNGSSGTVNVASTTLTIDVWKRTP